MTAWPPKNSIRVKLVFALVSVLFTLVISDAFLQAAYRISKGFYTWETVERFRVRDFTIRTSDTRYVTGKPNARIPNYSEGDATWSVSFDEHGFRAGLHRLSTNKPNIVVLGDSVPFGWGVSDDESFPSALHHFFSKRANEPYPIINAAMPSYSLDQAISRYELEIHGTFPVKAIIIQVIDPISQFTLLGRDWTTEKNWTTYSRWGNKTKAVAQTMGAFRYSSLNYFFNRLSAKEENESLEPGDTLAFEHFRTEVMQTLSRLHRLFPNQDVPIILVSSNTPTASLHTHSPARKRATRFFHETLKEFTLKDPKKNFFALNIEDAFPLANEEDYFIDDCCHLSTLGAQEQASIIGDILLENYFSQ